MHAIVISEPGGPDVLQWVEVPDPVPGAGEVVVETAATGMNRADVMQRQGTHPPPEGIAPYPGVEVSGRIIELGPHVTDWAVGDDVCAQVDGGGYAERVAVPAAQLLPVPAGLGMVEAAALPAAACTVWSTLVMTGALSAGESLLVHGGASGIGTLAIQLGKALGARVACTIGGTERAEHCRSLGAERVIDYRSEDFVAHGPYDLILDIIGAPYLSRNVRALAPDGRIVVIGVQGGSQADLDLTPLIQKRGAIHAASLRSRPVQQKAVIVNAVREHLWLLVEAGSVRPVVDRTMPMRDAAQAHELLEAEGRLGKMVLTL